MSPHTKASDQRHPSIRVLLVDDQALVRSGIRIILESEPDIEVVGEAATGVEAIAIAADTHPDVICMDVEMPEMDGIEASRRITASRFDTAILVLTTFGHDQYLFDALDAGVSGFLLKTSRAEQLIDAVRTLADGQALLGPDVTRAVIERVARGPGATPPAGWPTPAAAAVADPAHPTGPADSAYADSVMDELGLTAREREVLRHVAAGRSNSEIAAALFLGEATVKTHVSNLLQKMEARDRIQLVVWAHTRGIA